MIGAVTPTEVLLWARLSGPFSFSVSYGETTDEADLRPTETVTARAEDDFTVVLRLRDLKPDTMYYYCRAHVDGRSPKYLSQLLPTPFRTAPAGPARFSIGFGSCAKSSENSTQEIWRQVSQVTPRLFFWIGDNVYANTLVPQVLAEEYRRQRDITLRHPALRSIPQLAVWDDHDYGVGDGDRTNPMRGDALKVFKQYWPNPAYGLPRTPGVFFKFSYGGVDFFCLDERYHRDPAAGADGPGKSILGAAQFDWLVRELRASRAPFKLLIGGSGWTDLRGPHGDSWAAYLHERGRLFDFLRDEQVSGVMLLSGDMHQGQVNVIRRSAAGAYDLVEFVSSPLATEMNTSHYTSPNEPALRAPYTNANNFGWLTFDLTNADPTVSFELVNEIGFSVYRPVQIRASQLRNGISIWRDLADAVAKQSLTP